MTEKALYICSYNYSLEKVIQFKRLELATITSIQMGEYILSSLTPASRSEVQNYGMILSHSTEGELVRWNTGSIQNQSLGDLNIQDGGGNGSDITTSAASASSDGEEDEQPPLSPSPLNGISTITFKAVRYNVLGELDGEVETCKQQIQDIVKAITKTSGHYEDHFIIQKPIIRYRTL